MKTKGTLLKKEISGVYTAVSQLVMLKPPGWESKDYENPTFDTGGAGIPREMSGWVDGGKLEAACYWDPTLSVQQAILADVTTPVKCNWEIEYVNYAATVQTFVLSGTRIDYEFPVDKLAQMKITGNLDGLAIIILD